jgi:hypothetical protein
LEPPFVVCLVRGCGRPPLEPPRVFFVFFPSSSSYLFTFPIRSIIGSGLGLLNNKVKTVKTDSLVFL